MRDPADVMLQITRDASISSALSLEPGRFAWFRCIRRSRPRVRCPCWIFGRLADRDHCQPWSGLTSRSSSFPTTYQYFPTTRAFGLWPPARPFRWSRRLR